MHPSTRHVLFLAGLSGLIFFAYLGDAPLWDRDEPRNAGCAAEMLARRDWIVPVFNGELRTHKPVLLYWLMMSAYQCLGANEFSARFPSALLGIGTVLLTYQIGCRLFDRRVACWGGVILASTTMFGVASRAATPDSLLIFCSTAALALFVSGTFGRDGAPERKALPRDLSWIVAMYAMMGLGILAKGPVGLVLPTAVIGMFALIHRLPTAKPARSRWERLSGIARPFEPRHVWQTCVDMRLGLAVIVSGLVAAPWYIWVALRTDGEWTRSFFLEHNVSRALSPMEGHDGPAILFYLLAILCGCFPWSVLTIPTMLTVRQLASTEPSRRPTFLFLGCWIGVYVGIFSLAQTKLPSYVTPCYPALALLLGLTVDRWERLGEISSRWLRVGFGSLIVVGSFLAIGLPWASRRYLPGCESLGLIGLIPIIGGSVGWWTHLREQHGSDQADDLRRSRRCWSVASIAISSVLFLGVVMSFVPTRLGQEQHYRTLLAATASRGATASFGHLEPSWVVYGKRSITPFEKDQLPALQTFLDEHPGGSLLTTRAHWEAFPDEIRSRLVPIQHSPYFLRDRELYLLGITSFESPVEPSGNSIAGRKKPDAL